MNPSSEKPMLPIARVYRRHLAAAVMALASLAGSSAVAQLPDPVCGNPLVNTFGPFDYRVERGQKLKVVEDFHFNTRVETLVAGQSSTVAGDLDYVLRAFPNHHRALISMMRLGARTKGAKPPGAQFEVECYFRRALTFRADDAIARMIYVQYLSSNGRKPEANAELERVVKATPDSPITQHNAGLLYFEMGEFDKALTQAYRASALGFEGQSLKRQLQAAGKWVDPPSAEPGGAASSPDAATSSAASAPAGVAASAPSR